MSTRNLIHLLTVPGLLLMQTTLLAAEPAGAAVEPMAAGNMLRVLLSLLLVVAVIMVVAWLLRNVSRLQSGLSDGLKVMGGVSVGSRERLVLVQVGEQQLLLGVSPGRITNLHTLSDPIKTTAAGKSPAFAEQLSAVLSRRDTSA